MTMATEEGTCRTGTDRGYLPYGHMPRGGEALSGRSTAGLVVIYPLSHLGRDLGRVEGIPFVLDIPMPRPETI